MNFASCRITLFDVGEITQFHFSVLSALSFAEVGSNGHDASKDHWLGACVLLAASATTS